MPVRATKLLLVVLVFATGRATNAQLLCPEESLPTEMSFEAELVVDVGNRVLGAYTAAVVYDPDAVIVEAVRGGETPEFSAPPIHNPDDFQTGRTVLSGFNAQSVSTPTGSVSLFRVEMLVRTALVEQSEVRVEFITLADVNGAPIATSPRECSVLLSGPVSRETPTPTPAATTTPTMDVGQTCVGDCDRNGIVQIQELVQGIGVALGTDESITCRAFDSDENGSVEISELVEGVRNALSGCE